MTDRDQYSPIRVSTAVNALKNAKVAFSADQWIYSHDRVQKDKLFALETFEVVHFTASLAFHKDAVTETNRFFEHDSIYDCSFGIIEDYKDDEIGLIENDNSYMVFQSFTCSEKLERTISPTHYSYALKRRITETSKRVELVLSNKSAMSTSAELCECPVCFSETHSCLKVCKHMICESCVEMLMEPSCPLCRHEFKHVEHTVWNITFEDDDDFDDSDLDSDDEGSEFDLDSDEDEEDNEVEPELYDIVLPVLKNENEAFEPEDENEHFPVRNSLRIYFNLELHAAVFDPDRVHRLCTVYDMTPEQYLNSL
jgi:hypothetical protein